MKTLALVIITVTLVGCSVTYPIDRPVSLDLRGQPESLIDAAQEATDLWAAHGVTFTISDDLRGDLPVRVGDSGVGTWGDYTYEGPHAGEAMIQAETLVEPHAECTVMHELGHAVGLKHDEKAGTLMSKYLTICTWLPDNPCCWEPVDDEELCHVGGPCPTP